MKLPGSGAPNAASSRRWRPRASANCASAGLTRSNAQKAGNDADHRHGRRRVMNRAEMLSRAIDRGEPWDMVIIGGGAVGMGVAVDAASRGYEVLLVEQHDFGKGTSSRSTKLVHGGVRYLERGNVSLVKEALRERGLLRQNAPHLVRALAFIVPTYAWWES